MTDLFGGFGSELSTRLADKWLSQLALAGALYLAVCAAAQELGQVHSFDVPRLVRAISAWTEEPAATTVGGQVVLIAAVFAASTAVGLAVRALGSAVERTVLAARWRSWPRPFRALAKHRTRHRRNRWDAAHQEYIRLANSDAREKALRVAYDSEPRYAALRGRTAIASERPDRPTWSGDRMHAVVMSNSTGCGRICG
jgi:hypothetical protein